MMTTMGAGRYARIHYTLNLIDFSSFRFVLESFSRQISRASGRSLFFALVPVSTL